MTPSPVTPTTAQTLVPNPAASLCGNFINALLKFPVQFAQFIKWAVTETGTVTDGFRRYIIKPGDYIFSAAPLLEDSGRLLCDGRAVARGTYSDLFAIVGTMYGVGDGSLTFNLPDFRARFPVGVGGFPSGATVAIAGTGGEEKHILLATELTPHTHFIANTDTADNSALVALSSSNSAAFKTDHAASSFDGYALEGTASTPTVGKSSSVGGSGGADADGHNNLPPYRGVYIYVAT